MFIAHSPLLLASASPRRQEFLTQLGLEFEVHPADIDETPRTDELPEDFARRMARTKAEQIALPFPEACIVAGRSATDTSSFTDRPPSPGRR